MRSSRVVLSLLAGLLVALALHEIISVDLWLHLATGEWILAHHSVPRVDAYSFTAAGHEWVDLHWGYQVLVSLAYRLGGGLGLQILHGAATLGAFGIVLARLAAERRRALALAAAGLVLLVGQERVLCRPEAFTLLFLALTWRASEQLASGKRVHAAWLLVSIAWANMQALFILGPVFMLLRGVGAVVDARAGRRHTDVRVASRHVVAAACMLGVSLVGPYHVEGLLLPFRLSTQIAGASVYAPMLGELLSPFTGRVIPVLFSVLLAACVVAWSTDRERRAMELLPALAFAVLAISARRNLLIFGLVATPLVVRGLDDLCARLPRRAIRGLEATVIALLALALAAVAGGRYYYEVRSTKETGIGFSTREYPVAATRHLASLAPGGRVFNMLGDGDYLTYHLGPSWSVAFDGRAEVYGENLGRELLRSYADPVTFDALSERYRFRAILMDASTQLGRAFVGMRIADGKWTLSFLDGRAAVLVRRDVDAGRATPYTPPPLRDAGTVPDAEPLAPWALRVRFPFEAARLGRVLAELGYHEEAAAAFGQAVHAFPHSADLFSDLGASMLAAGRLISARAAFEGALELDPDHDAAATGVARVLERTEGSAAALSFLEPWCARHPSARRAWLGLAGTKARSGDVRGALATLEVAHRRISAASVPLAQLLSATGEVSRAEEVLRAHLSRHPNDSEALALLATLEGLTEEDGP